MMVLAYIVLRLIKFYRIRRNITFQNQKLLSGQHNGNKYLVVDKSTIPLSAQGNEYSVSFWLFVKDYNYRYGSNKTILYRGDKENTESNPYIYLNPTSNDMTIKVQLQTNTVKDSKNPTIESFNSSPLQGLDKRIFNKTDTLITCGLNDDWEFEKSFLKKNKTI